MTRIRKFLKRHGWSYLFILPSMTTFTVFVLFPVVWSFVISFQKFSIARGGTFVDPIYANYVQAFTFLDGKKLFVLKTQVSPKQRLYAGNIPGRIESIEPGLGVHVLTGEGILTMAAVQLEGQDVAKAWEVIKRLKTKFV